MPIQHRHKRVLKRMVENDLSRKAAMELEHYSPNYAETSKILHTDSWQELLEKELPDDFLLKRHRELLDKREVVKEFSHEQGEYVQKVIDQPDTNAVKAGLDMGYKIKRKYAPETHINFNIIPLLGGDSNKTDGHKNESNPKAPEIK